MECMASASSPFGTKHKSVKFQFARCPPLAAVFALPNIYWQARRAVSSPLLIGSPLTRVTATHAQFDPEFGNR